MTDVVVMLPGPPGDESWIDAAVAAARALEADGAVVDICEGVPVRLPDAPVVLGHGIQYESLARSARPGTTVLMSDRPVLLRGLEHVTVVDWAWYEAFYVAGAVAATVSAGRPVGLVAGPAVRTQRRAASAFCTGAASVDIVPEIVVVHLPAFDDVPGGERAGRRLVESAGCALVMGAADIAGAAAGREARALGARTIGFIGSKVDDVAHVRSDISTVLHGAVADALAGRPLPPVLKAGLASGHLGLELDVDDVALRSVLDEATARATAEPELFA